MPRLKRKLLSLLLVITMVFAVMPFSAFALENDIASNISWAGAMNFNNANNYVTDIESMSAPNKTKLKWAYPLNISVIDGGAYYAGQSVIAGGYLYATGGGKLHRIDTETGIGTVINESAGSTISYYDYLCYADGILILSTQDTLVAYSLDGTQLGSISGSYGYYHPVQYRDGYVICNGFIYKLEKEENAVTFAKVGDSTIGGDAFNWSSGVFYNDLFFVAAKTTVYAVDYKTNTVVDSYIFDASRTATQNVQGGLCLDDTTGRLYWATYSYNNYIHSIAIDMEEGETKGNFIPDSYISENAQQKSVTTPIVHNGRVYLAGQQGRICVLNADDLTEVYNYVTLGGGKAQGNPILSVADGKIRIYVQCSNGHLYMFADNGDSGSVVKLAETENYTKVLYPYAGFEQYAMDENGNIYCYNESGYLFCFGISDCEVPVISKNLSEDRVKYAVDAETEPLVIEASVSHGAGELSYQWQLSNDKEEWTDIEGAEEESYAPSSKEKGTTYYRCVVTNTNDEYSASVISAEAYIFVKELSDSTSLNVMVGSSNSATGGNRAEAVLGEDGIMYVENHSAKVTNIFLGVEDEGTVTQLNVLYGAETTAPKKYTVSNNDKYTSRYYKNAYTLPIVAKVTVTAEDGVTENEQYIVVSSGEAGKYITKASITSESELFEENEGISFTDTQQSAKLVAKVEETIGKGEIYNPAWIWTSSDKKVATVSENGVVTSIGGGEAFITASYQSISMTAKVNSTAPVHNTHTYTDGVCSACSTAQPENITAYFTIIDKNNEAALSKDAVTKINEVQLSVSDLDCDGTVTLNDTFIKVHMEHSSSGAADFVTEESTYGLYITKLWGEETSNVAYAVNNASAFSLSAHLKNDDKIKAYFYRDALNYSDIYTYLEGQSTVVAGSETEYTANGFVSSGMVIPKGATVKVYNSAEEEISSMTKTVGANGKFTLNFKDAGKYRVKVSGTASYTGQIWDSENGEYKDKEFDSAPVVASQIDVTVLPYVEKTVYVTIATKNGEFAVNKNGEEMWRFQVTASDSTENPDGVVTILEVLKAAHKQYHTDGEEGFGAQTSSYGAYITKLWGENNGGNCLYYFNDTDMAGNGIKIGTNGREWEDKLLDTAVEDNDAFSIYSLQATDYKKADLYTYFYPVSESATAGKEKNFMVKSVSGYGNNKTESSVVKVYDDNGEELTDLSTQVGIDGTFSITFTKKGTYIIDVRTNGANYISPSRLIVHVSPGEGGNTSSDESKVYISVKDPTGKTYLEKTSFEMKQGETAFSLLKKTGLKVQATEEYQYSGVYIESIEGLGEFDEGSTSGWMYSVNGEFPDYSSSLYELSDGDYVEWIYTKELGDDIGGGRGSASSQKEEIKEEADSKDGFSDVPRDSYYAEAIEYVTQRKLFNGISETEFAPESRMTRAMLVTVLYRMDKPDNKSYENSFSDVENDMWYTDAVSWAAENGIVKGISETQFAPDSNITREQMAVIMQRYARFKGCDVSNISGLSSYGDKENISSWAKAALGWANGAGIIKGTSENTLSPGNSATRGQVAIILMRYCENILK